MKKKRKITFRFKLVMLTAFLVYISISVIIQQNNINALLDEQQVLEERMQNAQTDLARLEHKSEYMGTKKYVENTAREKLGLVYDDELIFTVEE